MPAPPPSPASPAPQPRGWWAGLALGIAPQVLLLAVLAVFLRASTADDRPYLGFAALANLVVVPIAAMIGVPCVLYERSRPFGQALLMSTGAAASLATVAVLVVTAE